MAYQILGVKFLSPFAFVQKAYKSLVLKCHPDKCKSANGEEQFLQVRKAFEYIKRSLSLMKARSGLGSNQEDLPSQQQPGPNEFDLVLTLEEIFTGVTQMKMITIKVVNARGVERQASKILKVTVKPGSIAGSRIISQNEGDRLHGQIPANVVFIVREEPHRLFKRNRFDLEYTAKLNPEQACNRMVTVPSLDGERLQLTFNQVITSTMVERIPGKGLPILNGNGNRGDLLIKFAIIYWPIAYAIGPMGDE